MTVLRQRSYHDLSPAEKKRYDRLRALVHRLRSDPGGVRAKRCGSRAKRAQKLKAAADAMLGIRLVDTSPIEPESDRDHKPWTGSATTWASHARPTS